MTAELSTFLVPASRLTAQVNAIEQATRGSAADLQAEMLREPYGLALRYFLLFSSPEALKDAGLHDVTELAAFYNQYYWFKQFVKQRTAHVGHDAGLEQQAFQLLETAPADVDWSIIERIDDEVESS